MPLTQWKIDFDTSPDFTARHAKTCRSNFVQQAFLRTFRRWMCSRNNTSWIDNFGERSYAEDAIFDAGWNFSSNLLDRSVRKFGMDIQFIYLRLYEVYKATYNINLYTVSALVFMNLDRFTFLIEYFKRDFNTFHTGPYRSFFIFFNN